LSWFWSPVLPKLIYLSSKPLLRLSSGIPNGAKGNAYAKGFAALFGNPMKISRIFWANFRSVAGKLTGDFRFVIRMSREIFHVLSAHSLLNHSRGEREGEAVMTTRFN